jgi:ABC-type sugar transport system ATPase subunit
MTREIVEINNISKQFAGVRALDNVSFTILEGTCHCLVGENGAGKSTLIKILTGAHPKTSGTVFYNGKEWNPGSTRDAMRNGIGCLFQELNVVEKLRVEENIVLGLEKTSFGVIRKGRNNRVFDMLRRLDPAISPRQYIEELSVAKRQVVEMAKALAMDSRIIIMDEPTAVLTSGEVRKLFEIIGELKAAGITIIYITHRLEEVMELADYITVLRDGRHVATKPRAEISDRQDLIKMMIGKVLVEGYIPNKIEENKCLIKVENVSNAKLHGVNFALHKGEILGFYGLIGSGKSEIARAIYGVDAYMGRIFIEGVEQKHKSARKALARGVTMSPEERRTEGICTMLSISSNIPMMNFRTISKMGIRDNRLQSQVARKYIDAIGVNCRNENQSVAYLSGGNQQKVVIGKCLNAAPRVLLLDEPTRGVDVGAKQEIYHIIRRLVQDGCSAIVFSSELPEILGLCDRIGLLFDGRIVEFLKNDKDLDSHYILDIVTGGEGRKETVNGRRN